MWLHSAGDFTGIQVSLMDSLTGLAVEQGDSIFHVASAAG
jgi:hypothetical protein